MVEAGPELLNAFIAEGLIDQLEISITQVTGGDHIISLVDALRGFEITNDETVGDTRFVTATRIR